MTGVQTCALPIWDWVQIKHGAVFVNDEQLDEPYLDQLTVGAMPARLVPEEQVLVLGDNRRASNDSRAFGMVPYEDIVGKAWFRYWPFDSAGLVTKL